MNKHWTDQPDEVDGAEIVASFPMEDRSIEIRKGLDRYYFSVGNLFGSQTVACRDADAALRMLDCTYRTIGHPNKAPALPEGCELLPNA